MKKVMLCILTASLSLMFTPASLRAADSNVKTEMKMPVNSPVDPVTVNNKTVSPDPVKIEKQSQKSNWTRDTWIYISGAALLLIIILLIVLL
ncbi:MAG TPA: hypothetical protein VI731_01205 [Bacteroidia bacterium]|nr:hypothetical protein [Bacteroidia bacterium]